MKPNLVQQAPLGFCFLLLVRIGRLGANHHFLSVRLTFTWLMSRPRLDNWRPETLAGRAKVKFTLPPKGRLSTLASVSMLAEHLRVPDV